MPDNQTGKERRFSSFVQNNMVAVAVVVIVLFMFLPLPKTLIDIGMVVNLAAALTILLTVVYLRNAADFSSFPRIVQFITLYGLGLNISSTRNILMQSDMANQSEMVKTFANIVAGDSIVIGFVIFIILIVVQVLVVTKGAERVSEVKARFTLDSMNAKMLDIQNDLNAGIISEEEATKRKAKERREVDFYSAMDGSSKFVSGNVKAGIFITVINLVGGIITGMVPSLGGGMSFTDALNTYARLTIGDGLMSQLPSIMISFATGLLITGTNTEEEFSEQIKKEFTLNGSVYEVVGAALFILGAAFHNLSSVVLLPTGALFIFFGIRMQRAITVKAAVEKEAAANASALNQKGSSPDDIPAAAIPEPLSLEVGYALVPLVDKDKGAELLERVTRVRRESALDLGLVMPKIRIRDDMTLDPETYSFKIRGIEVGRGKLKPGYYMCLNNGTVMPGNEIPGEQTVDPAFGMPAVWLPESKRLDAEKAGYAVVDPPTIVATHLTEIIRRNAAEILTRQEVSKIIDKVKESNPVIVDEVLNGQNKFTYGEIETILKNLLSEQVSIRNMVVILETMANYAPITKDPWTLTEKVREALGSQICFQYCDENKTLRVLTLKQSLCEKMLEKRIDNGVNKPMVGFSPSEGRAFIGNVTKAVASLEDKHYIPIILCPSQVRILVKSSIERECPGVVVLSVNEVLAAGPSVKLMEVGEINE